MRRERLTAARGLAASGLVVLASVVVVGCGKPDLSRPMAPAERLAILSSGEDPPPDDVWQRCNVSLSLTDKAFPETDSQILVEVEKAAAKCYEAKVTKSPDPYSFLVGFNSFIGIGPPPLQGFNDSLALYTGELMKGNGEPKPQRTTEEIIQQIEGR